MSILTLIAQISFRGTALTDHEGIFFDRIIRGGPGTTAAVRGTDDVIPGAEGRFARNRVKDIRTIEIAGWITGAGSTVLLRATDYWANRAAAEALFDPTIVGELEVTVPGATFTINARALPSPLYREIDPTHAEASVEFESVDPDWS